MLLTRSLAVLSLVVATLIAAGGDASANHAWGTYHWARTANPFTLQVGNNMTGDWVGHLTTTTADWGGTTAYALPLCAASCVMSAPYGDQSGATVDRSNNPVRLSLGAGNTTPRKCRPSSGRIEACNATYGANGWLGLAQIWISGGHIVQGTSKMNDTYFNTSKYNNPNEKLHVVCQELAHTFGLGHQSENGSSQNSCMDYFSNTGAYATSSQSTRPNQHDFDQLATIYSHTDSYNSYTSGAASSSRVPVWAPGLREDGTPIGASPERGRYYVTDLPGGVQILTHVTWAEDRGHHE